MGHKRKNRKSVADRFLESVEPSTGCWSWKGAHKATGYGRFSVENPATGDYEQKQAHRVAYELFVGSIPEGMSVLHSCDNPNCVRPDHLRVGTASDNLQEAYDKGRATQVGEANAGHKLTEEDIKEIRASNKLHRELAEEYGVCRSNISLIKLGRSWGKSLAKFG